MNSAVNHLYVPPLSHCCLSSHTKCRGKAEGAPRHVEDSLLSHLINLSAGLTYLDQNKFAPQTVMPICLPTSEDFQDNEKRVFAAGIGVNRPREGEKGRQCFTDGSGPEVLQQCA